MNPQDANPSAAGLLSRKWTIQIVTALLHGPVRFSALQCRVAGISEKVLSRRLHELERAGLVTRRQYDEIPPRVEYALAPAGLRLEPVIVALERWNLEEALSGGTPPDG